MTFHAKGGAKLHREACFLTSPLAWHDVDMALVAVGCRLEVHHCLRRHSLGITEAYHRTICFPKAAYDIWVYIAKYKQDIVNAKVCVNQ